MADVFISYSRSDRPRCSQIRDALAALKVDVWFDAGIDPGHAFDREIEREIAESKAVLVLWSEASAASDWVRNEARAGKESDRLVAAQLEPCQLPLEFRSVQAELLAPDSAIETSPVWFGMLKRIGELVGRPGLADFARLSASDAPAAEAWRGWIAAYPADPLAGAAVARMVDAAAPELRAQLAAERARRAALEAELAEHADTSKAQAGELSTSGRELAKARRERDEAQAELTALRETVGAGGRRSLLGGDVGSGVVLDLRLAIYVALLLWVLAIWFLSSSIGRLSGARGDLADVFWLIFGIVALVAPSIIVTLIVMARRRALAARAEQDKAAQ